MSPDKKSSPSTNKSISISGDVKDSAVIIGDNNTVNQTFIQKFFNIFKSDAETLEERNRRILLNHVENAWIKGVLDASLHGAALLDLGIKPDPEAVTKYPWTIKKESTDETLPTGTSMLEIFDSIGMGRSLLILGAPGSGKTTMLLELARQLIAHAREDVTQPIPMVFNLSSWTESKTLADWLAQELNNLYSVPRKIAPDWLRGNKLLLLLDGLDEVRQESRAKCVEAINAFRKQNGMTSLAVCSRSQDYADLNAKLSFEGAIEVQPLTQKQITEFFNRFGKEMAGIKQVLKKDSALHEMAETPLFLSIMIMAYRDKQDIEILISGDEKSQRKHLFDTYIERMFERPRVKKVNFRTQDVFHWLSWLASKMIKYNHSKYSFEDMQPYWISEIKQRQQYKIILGLIVGIFAGLLFGLLIESPVGLAIGSFLAITWLTQFRALPQLSIGSIVGFFTFLLFVFRRYGLIIELPSGLQVGLLSGIIFGVFVEKRKIQINDALALDWNKIKKGLFLGVLNGLVAGLFGMLFMGLFGFLIFWGYEGFDEGIIEGQTWGVAGIFVGVFLVFVFMLNTVGESLSIGRINQTTYPGQRVALRAHNFLIVSIFVSILFGVIVWLATNSYVLFFVGMIGGIFTGLDYGGLYLIQHYTLRFILARNNLLPWRLVPFLDHCVDLIFLRRVGGGYIFVHRLLMEHFAEMYVDTPTSKGN